MGAWSAFSAKPRLRLLLHHFVGRKRVARALCRESIVQGVCAAHDPERAAPVLLAEAGPA